MFTFCYHSDVFQKELYEGFKAQANHSTIVQESIILNDCLLTGYLTNIFFELKNQGSNRLQIPVLRVKWLVPLILLTISS